MAAARRPSFTASLSGLRFRVIVTSSSPILVTTGGGYKVTQVLGPSGKVPASSVIEISCDFKYGHRQSLKLQKNRKYVIVDMI